MPHPHRIRSDWDARVFIEGVGDAERRLEVTPTIAGWRFLSFRTYTFRAGQVIDGESAADEMCMVLLSGAVTMEVAGPGWRETWECAGRARVEDGPPFAVYLPPGHTYRLTVRTDADCAYGRAPATGACPPRLITPGDLSTQREATAGNTVGPVSRTRILNPGDAEHLLCLETRIPAEAWAFRPPPRSDPAALPTEVAEPYREAVSYFRMRPETGWAMQRLSSDDGALDETLTLRHGDATIVRRGHHPVVAAPGTDVYALTFFASPTPAWPEDCGRAARQERTTPDSNSSMNSE